MTIQVQKHANVWMVVRVNSEGIVGVIRSYRSERAAQKAAEKFRRLG